MYSRYSLSHKRTFNVNNALHVMKPKIEVDSVSRGLDTYSMDMYSINSLHCDASPLCNT